MISHFYATAFVRLTINCLKCLYSFAQKRCITWPPGVLKNLSLNAKKITLFNTGREILFLLGTMYCSVSYINTCEIPNHFNLIYFFVVLT